MESVGRCRWRKRSANPVASPASSCAVERAPKREPATCRRSDGAVELVGQKEVAAREALGQCADGIGECDGFLIDLELFEGKGHGENLSLCPESRKEKVDRRRGRDAGEHRDAHRGVSLFSTLYFLLAPALLPLRGNRRSFCGFERTVTAFFDWFTQPSLQRAMIEELMADLASGEADNGPVAAFA
jgi:hypothetical protein